MIIKNIFSKIYISPFLYILLLIFLITGHIYNLLLFMSLIIIHELGHFLTASLLKWKVDKICLYPYGGISRFNELINVKLKEEFFVLVMGPLMQIFFFLIFKKYLPVNYRETFSLYNSFILGFNLLPIYPLDGGKIINIILSYIFSYKLSFKIVFIISYIEIGVVLAYSIISKSLFFILVIIITFIKLNQEYNLYKFNFNKFILERYLYSFDFIKEKYVNKIDDFSRDKIHHIKLDKKYIKEKDYLSLSFHNRY